MAKDNLKNTDDTCRFIRKQLDEAFEFYIQLRMKQND